MLIMKKLAKNTWTRLKNGMIEFSDKVALHGALGAIHIESLIRDSQWI